MISFTLTDDYIELFKLIKVLDLVDSGADAKQIIADGHVKKNGNVELKKRAKIISGDKIQIAEINILVK